MNAAAENRFWKKVSPEPNTGCWLWAASVASFGYGVFWVEGRQHLAHRLSWSLVNGPIPDGLCVLHRCDTPACVNPGHLFLGSADDNAKDRKRKGRNGPNTGAWTKQHPERVARGIRCPQAKLTDEAVREIRRRYFSGESQRPIARSFGIGQDVVSRIVNRRQWKHVE